MHTIPKVIRKVSFQNTKLPQLILSFISDMPTLPIPAGDSHFGNFSFSPPQFLKYCRNSQLFRCAMGLIENYCICQGQNLETKN